MQMGSMTLFISKLSMHVNKGQAPLLTQILLMIGFEDCRIIAWNVRGAMHESGKLFIKELIRSKKPEFIFLFETRCQYAQASFFWNSLGFTSSFVAEANGFSGGIWVMKRSNSSLSVRLLHHHPQAVTFEIWQDNMSWACSVVYASPASSQRDILWQHLSTIRASISIPWLLIGDMNEILFPSEVRGGEFHPNRAQRFATVLDDCNLIDLGMVGGKFTWFRKRNNRLILSKRLDRALSDIDWRTAFPDATVEVITRVHSDHSPLLVQCGGPELRAVSNHPFRFVAAWAEHPNYKRVVEQAWQRGDDVITTKLDCVRKDSEIFNKEVFGDILRRKRWVEGRLRGVQRELNFRVTSDMTQLDAALQLEYNQILKQEELLWFQRARGNNVRFGDRNTAYFHTHAVTRKRRNRIHRLKLADGD